MGFGPGGVRRPRGAQSSPICSDPASAQVEIGALEVTKALLFTVIPPLPRWGWAPLNPAFAQVGFGAIELSKASLFTVILPLPSWGSAPRLFTGAIHSIAIYIPCLIMFGVDANISCFRPTTLSQV